MAHAFSNYKFDPGLTIRILEPSNNFQDHLYPFERPGIRALRWGLEEPRPRPAQTVSGSTVVALMLDLDEEES